MSRTVPVPLLIAIVSLGVPACAAKPQTAADATTAPDRPSAAVNADAAALAAFEQRIDEYVDLHRRAESALPDLPKDATPEQIAVHQAALGERVRQARPGAKPGDIFTPEIRQLFRRLIGVTLRRHLGKEVREAAMDGNPGAVRHNVNGRYPVDASVSTVPPQILAALPRLLPEVEYRFVGRDLILRDTHADIVVDFMQGALR